jgi:hypothetical protein
VRVGQASISYNATTGDTTVTFTGTGDFYIGIKYDAGAVKNQTAPSPTTIHYQFSTKVGTTTLAGSTDGLDLVLKP